MCYKCQIMFIEHKALNPHKANGSLAVSDIKLEFQKFMLDVVSLFEVMSCYCRYCDTLAHHFDQETQKRTLIAAEINLFFIC
jgi:hypothetical protein